MAVKAIIFDIDGVLANSRRAVAHNTLELLREFGFPADPEKVEAMSTAHSADSVLVSLAPPLASDRKLLGEMLRRLSILTSKNMHLVEPTLISKSIGELAKKYSIAAASNRKSSARMVLGRLGILMHFKAVLTSEDAPAKPDPTMISMALERLGVPPECAVFVGDNEEDRMAGEAAGVEFVKLNSENGHECESFLKRFL